MRKNRELMPKDLKASCNPDMFKINTTKDIEDCTDLIYGQERGIKALNFGIEIDLNGYNLYLEGSSGVGKTMYTHRLLKEKAKSKPVPNDWVYVYNFEKILSNFQKSLNSNVDLNNLKHPIPLE